ncbi:MAG: hypothetical protein OK456_05865 [Thaumarchaeota archaeon]|nr:hypothetical protein [Nitrososphaerota archaeon]
MKRTAFLACIFLIIGGFMFFAPVVNLRSVAPVTTGVISIKIDTNETTTGSLCSIAFCYGHVGAVYAAGVYYPVTRPAVNGIHGQRTVLIKQPDVLFPNRPVIHT